MVMHAAPCARHTKRLSGIKRGGRHIAQAVRLQLVVQIVGCDPIAATLVDFDLLARLRIITHLDMGYAAPRHRTRSETPHPSWGGRCALPPLPTPLAAVCDGEVVRSQISRDVHVVPKQVEVDAHGVEEVD